MKDWTRRDVLKTALAASAGAATTTAMPWPVAAAQTPSSSITASSASPAIDGLSPSPRERLLLDFGWRFQLGNASDPARDCGFGALGGEGAWAKSGSISIAREKFDDSSWRTVDLPHDWGMELPFVKAPELPGHGGRPLGREFPESSIGWYRRIFSLAPADAGKRISLEFDGIYRNAMVFLNGHIIGQNTSGYAPFSIDVTDFLNLDRPNVLAVRVDATENEGWFYEGAGVYRHVWLTKTDPLHVPQWGAYVRSEVQGNSATLFISTEVANDADKPKQCRVTSRIVDAAGKTVALVQTNPAAVDGWGKRTFASQAKLARPALWSIEEPNLYRLLTTVEADGSAADRHETTFGIRTIRFDAEKGFFLNDKPVKIKGTCNHQDHAGVGIAVPDRLNYYRIERLKEMGSNGYRTSHNPPTPELLDACDRLGMLVMDETRVMSSSVEGLSQLERLVRRDRNHPSIVIWSLGNEEPEQGTARGERILTSMKRLVRRLDPSRPVTEAMNNSWGKGATNVVDVQGFNYSGGGGANELASHIDEFHQKFPQKPIIGTETASALSTRGIYAKDEKRGYVSAYDLNAPKWGSTSEQWWKVYDARPFLAGGFAWTGFDYHGEPTPYEWPCNSSHFGIMDLCGFPKDNFFYYQAVWGSKPVLHLFPHWNWSGKEGQEIDVWCHTNLDTVELFLNGVSLGRRSWNAIRTWNGRSNTRQACWRREACKMAAWC
jgi:beta-galactosidase